MNNCEAPNRECMTPESMGGKKHLWCLLYSIIKTFPNLWNYHVTIVVCLNKAFWIRFRGFVSHSGYVKDATWKTFRAPNRHSVCHRTGAKWIPTPLNSSAEIPLRSMRVQSGAEDTSCAFCCPGFNQGMQIFVNTTFLNLQRTFSGLDSSFSSFELRYTSFIWPEVCESFLFLSFFLIIICF